MSETAETKKTKKTLSKKSLKTLIIISAVVLTILSFFGGYFTHYFILGREANTAAWIVGLIEQTYCVYDEETGKVKEFSAEDYADTLVSLLDKYSRYYTKEEYTDVISTSKGNNYGFGVNFITAQNDCKIFKVIGNSPAEKAGLKDGDTILSAALNGVTYEFTGKQQILDFLGSVPEDEQITLTVDRNGAEKEFLVRKSVFITSYVKYYDSELMARFVSENTDPLVFTEYLSDGAISGLGGDTAYVSLSSFEGGASVQIATALEFMSKRGRSKLILDLRDNGGGYMDVLSEVSAFFVYGDDGKNCTVAVVKDKDGKQTEYYSNRNAFRENITEISVLANENTASASECLIGAMLFYGRAFGYDNLVIEKGDDGVARTYGKGIMQTTYTNIFTGEALKLTTAYVFWPDCETTIHGKGIRTTETNSVDKGEGLGRAIALLG